MNIAELARKRMLRTQVSASRTGAGSHAGTATDGAYIGQVARRKMVQSKEKASPFKQLDSTAERSSLASMLRVSFARSIFGIPV